jgi:hypothetical protein
MLFILRLTLILAAPGAAEPLSDKIDRDYVQPVLQQLQGALDGREPNWTPPVLPGSAQTTKLSERVRSLWLEPLMGAGQRGAFAAASSLASPRMFEPPAEPEIASLLPDASISPITEELVRTVERRFFSRLFTEDDATQAAGALGSEGLRLHSDVGAAAAQAGPRVASPGDFVRGRKYADSTRLAHGSAGGSTPPKLKAFHSSLSSTP